MALLKDRRPDPILLSRLALLIALDVVTINLAAFLALFIRFEFDMDLLAGSGFWVNYQHWSLFNTALTMGTFGVARLYSSLWSFAGADELVRIFAAAVAVMITQFLAIVTDLVPLPRSFPVLYGMLLFIFTTVLRFSYRFFRRVRSYYVHGSQRRTLLIGAGRAGSLVIREFRGSAYSQNKIVCAIDDDPGKLGRQIMGVKIVGDRTAIADVVEKYNIAEIVLAIPTLSVQSKREIWDICSRTGCKFKQMPGLYQLANGEVTIQQIRDIDIEDLLEREPVHVDLGGLSDLICGKTVMVTGGGGSIGSELCRQLASYGPKDLVIFDIYENNTYAIEQELRRDYPELTVHALIGSVRDKDRIGWVMQSYRPAIVYHAAAHKHVPLMENAPLEAVKNNIFGTYHTALAAMEAGIEHFVLISTDKAVNPTNVMGASKRVCEMIIQSLAGRSDTCFTAVRFGNVLGSNGSVIPVFREQIRRGGPVTVTHPEITRYFMTIPEAVTLVLQAGAYAQGGEIFVLDMGQPVKIDDLARNMIRLSGFQPDVDIQVVYTGLRPGEKLYEELLLSEEGLTKTANDLIYIGHKLEFDQDRFFARLDALHELQEGQEYALRHQLRELVPTYAPAQTVPV